VGSLCHECAPMLTAFRIAHTAVGSKAVPAGDLR
jgi:hypothetical protein